MRVFGLMASVKGNLTDLPRHPGQSQDELAAVARANTAAFMADAKPHGWTASEKITFHTSRTFMDYLHGDVKDKEAEFVCRYEYARESKDMWDAAKLRDEAKAHSGSAFWRIHHEFAHWIQVVTWATDFLMCKSFPHKDWNALNDAERKKLLSLHETRKVPPLKMQFLHYSHYPKQKFPEFNELAEQNKPVVVDVRPGERQEPVKLTEAMVQKSGSVYHCLFVVDFSESPKPLSQRYVEWLKLPKIESLRQKHRKAKAGAVGNPLRTGKVVRWTGTRGAYWCSFQVDVSARKGDLTWQFKKWLASPKNKQRLKRHKHEKRGTSDKWKDRLKDLAAWRLVREITNEPKAWIWANEYACQHRKKKSVVVKRGRPAQEIPRAFRDAKGTKNSPASQAQLFSDQAEASDAARNAWDLLEDWIPSEFKKHFSELMNAWGELGGISSKR